MFFPLAFQSLVEVYVGQSLEEGGDLVVEEVGALQGGQEPHRKVLEKASSCDFFLQFLTFFGGVSFLLLKYGKSRCMGTCCPGSSRLTLTLTSLLV